MMWNIGNAGSIQKYRGVWGPFGCIGMIRTKLEWKYSRAKTQYCTFF